MTLGFRICLAAVCALLGASSAAAWDCNNANRTPVTITAGLAGHNEEIRIELASADFPASYTFSAAGDDIRVFAADDTTPVDHIVTGWDSVARTAIIYVRPAALAASASTTLYVYYGDAGATSLGDAPSVFPDVGLRLRSRVSTVDPTDAASASAAFAAATVDVYDSPRASFTGLNNRALGGTNGDYGWCISGVIEVTAATTGTWDFRYGADFGRGGHLYVREQPLEEDWNDDLWWAGNYANTAETLEGSVTLPAGWHRYEALGFEGCCDGTSGFQARAPGGAWQDLNTTNFDLRASRCVVTTVTPSPQTPETCSTTLDASKGLSVISDSLGNADPYALPGSVVEYEIDVMNTGQSVDAGTIELTDALPPNVKLIVSGGSAFLLSQGAIASGLTLTYVSPTSTGDDVSFSTNGTDFTYVPVVDGDGADSAITHVRFSPGGAMNAHVDGDDPSFTITFQAMVE